MSRRSKASYGPKEPVHVEGKRVAVTGTGATGRADHHGSGQDRWPSDGLPAPPSGAPLHNAKFGKEEMSRIPGLERPGGLLDHLREKGITPEQLRSIAARRRGQERKRGQITSPSEADPVLTAAVGIVRKTACWIGGIGRRLRA